MTKTPTIGINKGMESNAVTVYGYKGFKAITIEGIIDYHRKPITKQENLLNSTVWYYNYLDHQESKPKDIMELFRFVE